MVNSHAKTVTSNATHVPVEIAKDFARLQVCNRYLKPCRRDFFKLASIRFKEKDLHMEEDKEEDEVKIPKVL